MRGLCPSELRTDLPWTWSERCVVVHILSDVGTENIHTPARLETLVPFRTRGSRYLASHCTLNPSIHYRVQICSVALLEVRVVLEVLSQEHNAVTSLVNPQILITADEASQVVGSFPLSEDFAAHTEVTTLNTSSTSTSSFAPVYNRVRQKLFDAEETTQNPVEIFSSRCTSTVSDEIAKMLDNLKKTLRRRLKGLRCSPSG